MPAKTITRDIGQATYNAFSSEAPPVADNVGLIKAVGTAASAAYDFSAKEALVGEEGAQVPGLEGLGEARIKPGEEFDIDAALNLRQIKRAKEQGIINETQARLKVGQAIRAVAEDFPGQEDKLRKRAATYFGKFGEGDLVLTKSAQQKTQESIFINSFIKPGVAAGIIDPQNSLADIDGQATWQKLTHDRSIRAQTRDVVQTQAEVGKASGLDVTNSYIASDVSDDIALGLNNLIKLQNEGKAITDPLEIKGLFAAQKVKHKQVLRNKLVRVKGMTSDQKKSALAEIDNAYKDLDALIDNGSLVKMLEQKQDLLTKTATIYGVSRFPQLFAAEKVSPGIGTQLLKMSDTFARMKNDASRQAYINRQPPMMRQFIKQTLNDPMGISELLSDAMTSNTLPGNDFLDSLFLSIAKEGMHTGSENPDETNTDFKDQSISFVLKNAPSIGSLETLNSPSVAPRIRKDKRKVAMLTNKFVAHETSVIPRGNAIINEGRTTGRDLSVTFDFNTRKFALDLQLDPLVGIWPGGHSQEEAAIVDRLNILYNTIDYYGPELGIKPVEWVMKTLDEVNKTIEPEKEE